MAGQARGQFTDPVIKKLLARLDELPDCKWRQSGSHLIVMGPTKRNVCVSLDVSSRRGRTLKNTLMRLKRVGIEIE